jgi:hypothetical protein
MYISSKIHYTSGTRAPGAAGQTEIKRYISTHVTGGLQKSGVTRDTSLVRIPERYTSGVPKVIYFPIVGNGIICQQN